jgi:hypothetical protein
MYKKFYFAIFVLLFSISAANAQYSSGGWGGSSNCSGGGSGGYRDGSYSGGDNLRIVGLTNGATQRLICFDEFNPGSATTIGTVNGLVGDTRLVGIDFRPATGNDGDGGDLYGLGDQGGIYTLNLNTAQAILRSRLNVALSGTFFGVDFNPAVDRLRIVSDNGQNLRANVDTGATIVDTPLNYTPGVPASGITGAAYTNNDADTNTATTLYTIDSMLDQVNIQAPPNAGTQNPTGKLTVDTTLNVGFDIYSTIRNNTTINVEGFSSLTVGGSVRFYSITLFTGRASNRGSFSSQNQVTDIAIPLNQR